MKALVGKAIVLLLVLLPAIIRAQTGWVQVGDTLDGAHAYDTHLAFGPSGEAYVAYQSRLEDVHIVRKYNGSSWEQIGGPAVYLGNSSFGFAVDKNGVPYIACDSQYSL